MLFKFKSHAASDLIMFEADARRLLKIMIGDDPVKGILQVHALPQAIQALELNSAKRLRNLPPRFRVKTMNPLR
jgi:hypothetical protein